MPGYSDRLLANQALDSLLFAQPTPTAQPRLNIALLDVVAIAGLLLATRGVCGAK